MANDEHEIYEFGAFRLKVREHVLLGDGQPLHLAPQVFDLLVALVRSNGQMLTKDELIQHLWPDRFVGENSLAVIVFALRKALGETGNGECRYSYVQTIPRRGYRFNAEVTKVSTDRKDDEKLSDESSSLDTKNVQTDVVRSIAVLPLRHLGTELNDEYLGLGLADALITKLGNLRQIHVRPTSAVRKYAEETGLSLAAIGHELGVDFLLEGSIRRSGNQMRATIQLVSVRDGLTLWSERFHEEFTDIFKVEDLISHKVASALALRLTVNEQRVLTRWATRNTEAYKAYMKGRFFYERKTHEGLQKSVQYFMRAVELDADYAQPYAGLAEAYVQMAHMEFLTPQEAYLQASQYVSNALERDGELVEAKTAQALLQVLNHRDWKSAEAGLRQAIELNQNCALAYQRLTVCLRYLGRFAEAMEYIDKAQELDPTSSSISTTRALTLYFSRRYDEAGAEIERALELNINYPIAYLGLGLIRVQQGQYGEAIRAFEKVNEILEVEHTEVISNVGYVYAVSGRQSKAQQQLERLLARGDKKSVSSYFIATIFVGLRDLDQAFTSLNKSFGEGDPEIAKLKVDPMMDTLRSDPRYGELLRNLGLVPASHPEVRTDR